MARQPRRLAGIGAADLVNAAAFDSYIGPSRELVVDPVRSIIALHDGVTPGGKRFPSLATPASTTAAGIVELATSAETVEGSDAERAVTPAGLKATRIAFKAHKNNVAQTITANTFTDVALATEEFDIGSYYDVATSRWTPPAGIYRVSFVARVDTGIPDGEAVVVAIYKNGSIVAANNAKQSGSTATSALVTTLVQVNGTDYISAVVLGSGSGNKDVSGLPAYTHFSGEAI